MGAYLQVLRERDKHPIRHTELPAYEVLLPRQRPLQHAQDPKRLVHEPPPRLGVRLDEGEVPRRADVGRLEGRVEENPLQQVGVRVGIGPGETDLPLGVIGLEEVFDYGAGFPEGDARVGVFDDGGEAVWGQGGGEGGFLLIGGVPDMGCVGEGELFEEEGDFPRVGAQVGVEGYGLHFFGSEEGSCFELGSFVSWFEGWWFVSWSTVVSF